MKASEVSDTGYNEPFILQRADPFVCRAQDGTYYFTASVPEYDRIVLRHSDTIQGLKDAVETEVWHGHASGPQSKHIWAPELHYIFGGWYLYYAAGEKEDEWKIRPYVLKCESQDPMKGPWMELGRMQPADEDPFSLRSFSLDATIMEHKGSYYYIWAEKTGVGQQISNLYIARMQGPAKLATAQVLLTTPDYDWERVGFWVDEGPAVLRHGGKIFLTFSASATGACYCMGLMSIEEDAEILDPNAWKKERWPVLKTDEEKGIYGPGHNSFVKAEDGQTDLCVLHFRQYDEIVGDPLYDPNRHVMILPVAWDENGNPVFQYRKAEKKGDV